MFDNLTSLSFEGYMLRSGEAQEPDYSKMELDEKVITQALQVTPDKVEVAFIVLPKWVSSLIRCIISFFSIHGKAQELA